MTPTSRTFLATGALLMALGVMAGAFGAHLLRDSLGERYYDIYQTAVSYHIYHALGLLVVGLTARIGEATAGLLWSGRLMIAGILLFSGSLYLLALTETGWLGAVTPLGGVAFIAGWILFALSVLRSPAAEHSAMGRGKQKEAGR